MDLREMKETDGGLIWFVVAAVLLLSGCTINSTRNTNIIIGSENTITNTPQNDSSFNGNSTDSTFNGNSLSVPPVIK